MSTENDVKIDSLSARKYPARKVLAVWNFSLGAKLRTLLAPLYFATIVKTRPSPRAITSLGCPLCFEPTPTQKERR
jgi:hypothetical protein